MPHEQATLIDDEIDTSALEWSQALGDAEAQAATPVIDQEMPLSGPGVLTSADFVVPGREAGYRYPFQQQEAANYSGFDHTDGDIGSGQEVRGEDGIYREPGFVMQEAVHDIPGPILEIGGPTIAGFNTLHDVDLPSRPLMTNIMGNAENGIGSQSLTAIDSLTLDALADSRAMPIRSESLGMVLAASVPWSDQNVMRNTPIPEGVDGVDPLGAMVDKAYVTAHEHLARGDVSGLLQTNQSPRIATLLESARMLKPDGLLVMQGVLPDDVKIAHALGMDVREHTPVQPFIGDGSARDSIIQEVVFQKESYTGRHRAPEASLAGRAAN